MTMIMMVMVMAVAVLVREAQASIIMLVGVAPRKEIVMTTTEDIKATGVSVNTDG